MKQTSLSNTINTHWEALESLVVALIARAVQFLRWNTSKTHHEYL